MAQQATEMLSQASEIDKVGKKKEEEKFLSDSVKMGNLNTSIAFCSVVYCIKYTLAVCFHAIQKVIY